MFDDAKFEREIHQSAVVKICLGQANTFWKPVWLFRQCALNTCMLLFRISLLIHMKKSLQVLEKLKTHRCWYHKKYFFKHIISCHLKMFMWRTMLQWLQTLDCLFKITKNSLPYLHVDKSHD